MVIGDDGWDGGDGAEEHGDDERSGRTETELRNMEIGDDERSGRTERS